MASRLKKKVFNNKKNMLTVIVFFIFILVISVKAVNAFYNNTSTPAQLVRSIIGNFEAGDGDITIEVYRETGYGTGIYVKNYFLPSNAMYNFGSVDCSINECETTNNLANCYYNYNPRNSEITVTSNRKLTCKFYFDKKYDDTDADIKVYIMREDINNITVPKTYVQTNDIPVYGFRFSNITCDNNVEPTYDSRLRKFNFTTTSKTTCYAYFDSMGLNTADVIANIYVQSDVNSDTYAEVETIPSNVEYEISTNPNYVSNCMTMATPSVPANAPTMDEDGYLIINTNERVTCTVYLDIVTE